MRRPHYRLIITVVVGLVLAACASPAASGEPGASSGSEPSAAAEASQGDGGGGGAGGIGITLSDGTWTDGDVHVTISGDANATLDAPIASTNSYTTGASTILTYILADSGTAIAVAIYSDSFAISVTTAELVAGAGTTMNCDVEYHSAEDNNIDADFSCPNSPSFTTSGAAGGSVDIEGSLTASR